MTYQITRLLLAAAGVACLAVPAWAHAHLQASTPSAGSTVQVSPAKISMDFTEGLVLAFSGLSVTNGKGTAISLGDPALSGVDGNELAAFLVVPLLPGPYHVSWHALSKDSHKTNGTFDFVVGP